MDLSEVTTEDLRAELHRRLEAQRIAEWATIAEQFPCPECEAPPVAVGSETVEEFRFAPRDDEGRPELWSPYGDPRGTTHGVRDQITVTCENGHITTRDEIRWFDQPRTGPPMLST